MTPAIVLLKQAKVLFNIHQYEHNPNEQNFGQEAVEKLVSSLGIVAEQVFKTLVVTLSDHEKDLAICVLPVPLHLDLKKVAKSFKCKKVELAKTQLAQKVTGYLVGGISPIGQKKQLPTLIDETALLFSTIFVSAGRRGLEIELSPQRLTDLLNGKLADISC